MPNASPQTNGLPAPEIQVEFSIRVPLGLSERLAALAKQEHRTRNQQIVKFLGEAMAAR